MDQEKPVAVSLTGKISYNDNITMNQAAQIIAFIDSTTGAEFVVPASATRLAPEANTRSLSTARTPRDAIEESGAKTNAQKIVAFAALIHEESGQDGFTVEDIKPLFRRAREATPANLNRDFDGAIRSRWIADSEVKGEYYLTAQGASAVAAGFEKAKNTPSGDAKVTRKRRHAVIEMPEAFKDFDEIPQAIDGFPNYSELTQGTDRLLWVLQMASTELKLDGLSNNEVVWLTDHLGAAITPNNVSATFNAAKKQLRANRALQTNKIRITSQGEQYLRGLTKN